MPIFFKLSDAARIVLLLLASIASFSQDATAEDLPPSIEELQERTTSPICRGCHGSENDLNPLIGRLVHYDGDDSYKAIKQRAGSGDPVAGKTKSELCQGCHGEDGNSIEPHVPKLAGQFGLYISKQLRNYQSGIRTHQIMNAMAAEISDADLADIAAYFAYQPIMDGRHPRLDHLGQKMFYHSDKSRGHMACVNCHGIAGKGLRPTTAMFPVIGGQHKEYLLAQLRSFKNDDRSNSPNAIMNKIAKVLSDEEIEALAEYISEQ